MNAFTRMSAPPRGRYSRTAGAVTPARRRVSPRSVIIAGITAVVLFAAAGGALAFWVAASSGSGSATSGTSVSPLTVTPGTVTTGLRPGSSVNVAVSVANSNSFAVSFYILALDTTQGSNGYAIDATHVGLGCTPALAGLTFTTLATGWTVPPSSSLPIIATAALTMNASAATGCQGATITVYVKAS